MNLIIMVHVERADHDLRYEGHRIQSAQVRKEVLLSV